MNAEQWKTVSARRWVGEAYDDCVWRVIDAIAAAGISTDDAVRRLGGEAAREASELRQTSGELCPRCGWRMVLPGDGCMKCECERLRGAAKAVPKPDAERHAAITIAMNVSAGAEVERPAALRMVQWVLSQNPPWVVDEACRLVRDKWPAPESLECVADWVLSQPSDVPAPPDPEREERRWELYRDLVVREYAELQDALRIADAALAAYYGEQHGS